MSGRNGAMRAQYGRGRNHAGCMRARIYGAGYGDLCTHGRWGTWKLDQKIFLIHCNITTILSADGFAASFAPCIVLVLF